MPTRKNTSRSKEIDIVLDAFNGNLKEFKEYIVNNPKGGKYSKSNLFFYYGNIERLINSVEWELKEFISPIKDIVGIYHLDSISINLKKEIERELNLHNGILTSKSKADILVLSKTEKFVLSFKDGSTPSKLGQVSTEMRYNQAVLRGGFILPFSMPEETRDMEIDQTKTALTKIQFDKLKYKDRYFAFIKYNYKETWDKYVKDTLEEAIEQLINFGKIISEDRESLTDFILITLFGRINIPNYFNLLINDKLIYSEDIVNFFKKHPYLISCEEYKTENKFSLIISITIEDTKYGITKIEPAFDGAKKEVSQTKGIIYYFQQFPTSEKHIWELLKNIPK